MIKGLADFGFSAFNVMSSIDGKLPRGPDSAFEAVAEALTVKQSEVVQGAARDFGKVANLSTSLIRTPSRGLLGNLIKAYSSAKHIIYSAGKLFKPSSP